MDSIIFYQPPLDVLSSSSAASRFPARCEAAIAAHRIPRLGIMLGSNNTALQLLRTSRGQIVLRTLRTPSGMRVLFQNKPLNTIFLPAAVGISISSLTRTVAKAL